MKQVLQSLKTGVTELAEVPCPQVRAGHLLIRTSRSLISPGTERMLLEFGKAGLIAKARQQPDKVREVLDKVKVDGLAATLDAVQSKLDQPLAPGYCNAGVVMEVGEGVEGFAVGDRVASNGSHAEVVCVPKHLCAKLPDAVSYDEAAFTVISSIALQGIRLAEATLGEGFMVTGLGLVGLLTVQLLQAQGCRVIGADFDPARLELARECGAETADLSRGEDPVASAMAFSRGRGVDGVIITASTKSNEPVHQAAQMCRKRGRIILVGVTGLELSRSDFYEKELTFQVSCSYGPGRYDPAYEDRGQDYPLGFVRWTEQRNFEAVLDMLAAGHLDVEGLISHRFSIEQAQAAYELLEAKQGSLGIVLEYPDEEQKPEALLLERTIRIEHETPGKRRSGAAEAIGSPAIGVIGAGNYASRVLMPAIVKTGARLKTVASGDDLTGTHAAHKYKFDEATTDVSTLFADAELDAVMIATRHNTHAQFVCEALGAGKHTFVEKPLAMNDDEVATIEETYASAAGGDSSRSPMLMVGFNRRFAPHIQRIKGLLEGVQEPKSMVFTANAGEIPADHWTQLREVGGGRIIGEACHYIDLLRYLVGFPIDSLQAMMMGAVPGVEVTSDKMSFTLGFADGSFGTVHYLANGHKSFPKERLEIFCAGRILQLDNFRKLRGYGWPGFTKMNLSRQDKGHRACTAAFVDAVRHNKPAPIPFDELVEVTRVSFAVVEAAQRKGEGRGQGTGNGGQEGQQRD